MKTRIIFCMLISGILLTLPFRSPAQSYGAPTLPEFMFQTMDGKVFTKAEMVKNKTSIFILFDVTCEHCMHEISDIAKNYDSFKDVEFYLVSMDNKQGILSFISNYGKGLYGRQNVTVLQDFRSEFVQKFRPERFPALFVYSKTGSLIKYMAGQKKSADILKVLKK